MCKVRRFFKVKNFFLISFLAVAGIFSAGAFAVNKQAEDAPIVKESKAESMGELNQSLIIGDNNSGKNFVNNCSIAVYCWGNGWEYCMAANVIGDTLRSVALPSNTSGFKVLRMDSNSGGYTYLPYAGYPSNGVYNALADTTFDSSKNMYQVLNTTFTSTSYTVCARSVLPKGATVRFCATKFGDWTNDGAVPYVYTFANDYYGTHAFWHEMTRIGNTQYFSYTANIPYVLDGFIFTRNNPSGSGDWGSVWTQTANVYVNRSGGLIMIDSNVGGSSCSAAQDADYAEMWGAVFFATVTCSGSGSMTSGTTEWEITKNEYNNLTTNQQGIVYDAVGSLVDASYLKMGVYRYDYILFKKGYSDFEDYINRKTSGSKTPFSIRSFKPFDLMTNDEVFPNSILRCSISSLSLLIDSMLSTY